MRLEDIRRAITEKGKTLKTPFYYENVSAVKRPYYFIEIVDYGKEFHGIHQELVSITFDIIYHPKDAINFSRMEIISAMEKLDDNFEIVDDLGIYRGKKILNVGDRYLTIKNSKITEVDGIGHYMFDLEFFDLYGTPYPYELMKELELEMKESE